MRMRARACVCDDIRQHAPTTTVACAGRAYDRRAVTYRSVVEERHPSAPGVLHGVMYACASATGLRLRLRLFARTCHLELLEGLVAQRVKAGEGVEVHVIVHDLSRARDWHLESFSLSFTRGSARHDSRDTFRSLGVVGRA